MEILIALIIVAAIYGGITYGFAAWGGAITKGKGRSRAAGAWLGGLLGILGILIALTLPRIEHRGRR